MSKNMITRILSGTGLLIACIIFHYFGGLPLLLALLFCSEVGLFEFYRATGVLPEGKKFSLLSIAGYLFTAVYYCMLYFGSDIEIVFFSIASAIVLAMLIFVFSFPKIHATQVAYMVFGVLYVSVMLGFVYRVRDLENGIFTVWLIYIASWVCDTFAYLIGVAIGKHKLAPVLSPKKSIEGSLGGIFGSLLAGFLYSFFILEKQMPGCTAGILIVCGVGAIVSQTGDLAASAIKRNHDIKDYGHLIPGHGGILDRFDSVIFTAPMIFYLLKFIVFK